MHKWSKPQQNSTVKGQIKSIKCQAQGIVF